LSQEPIATASRYFSAPSLPPAFTTYGDVKHSYLFQLLLQILTASNKLILEILGIIFPYRVRVIKLTIVIIELSFLPASYKTLSNILLSRVTPYADEIIGDHQCGFRCNRSTFDQIFYTSQMLVKNNGTVHQLFIDFKKD
jgi:hypothetical protein